MLTRPARWYRSVSAFALFAVGTTAGAADLQWIDSGGTGAGGFGPDANFDGGAAYIAQRPVDVSCAVEPAPEAVYQTYRYRHPSDPTPLVYQFPGLAPDAV